MVSVQAAVQQELDAIAKRDKALAESALAALALAMAREIDNARNSATSKAMCAGRLHDAMDRLRELAPPKAERTRLDELRDRKRQSKAAG